ncbi:MAG: MFS transporter [Alphaproteobacteria bacterium]|nr:MFS transporter [Alphaproteobacteria bacterium]
MIAAVMPVAALLLSAAFLLMGNGLQGTLLPVRANIEGFAFPEIGLISTAYYIGFGAGCYYGGRIVRRAGHIRTFAAMASLASAIALIHALIVTPELWWLMRAVAGFCFAVLYVVVESWLNECATNDNRGRILSIYNVINLTVITVGQMMLTLADPRAFPLFALASILVSLAVVPLAMTTTSPPAPVEIVRIRLRYLYSLSPVGCVGVFIVGLVNGAFWALAPVFAQGRSFDLTGIALFMSTAVLAGAVGQWPLGRLSDLRDRRYVIVGASTLAAVGGVAMVFSGGLGPWTGFVSVAVFGSMALPIYSLCLAHMNDFAPKGEFVATSSAMLLLYAAGAALGPIPASFLMGQVGPQGLFTATALGHAALAAFTLMRIYRRTAPAMERKEPFITVPRTSPTFYALDPRSDAAGPEELI